MVLSPEELAIPKPETKNYLSRTQLFQGLRKRPGWYGWRNRWGSYTASPKPPANTIPYWRYEGGHVMVATAATV